MLKRKKRTKRSIIPGNMSFWEFMDVTETRLLVRALRRTKGNQKEAASLLRLSPQTLYEKIKRLRTKRMPTADEQLNNILDAIGESILKESDEEILAETTEQQKKNIKELREKLLETCRNFK